MLTCYLKTNSLGKPKLDPIFIFFFMGTRRTSLALKSPHECTIECTTAVHSIWCWLERIRLTVNYSSAARWCSVAIWMRNDYTYIANDYYDMWMIAQPTLLRCLWFFKFLNLFCQQLFGIPYLGIAYTIQYSSFIVIEMFAH